MRYRDDSIFEQIRQVAGAEELASRYLGLNFKVKGRRKWACCPVHSEKTPSLCLYPDGRMKCFGCDFTGDGTALVAEAVGMEMKAAANMIAEDYGLSRDHTPEQRRAITNRIKEKQAQIIAEQRFHQEVKIAFNALVAIKNSLREAAAVMIVTECDLEKPEAQQLAEGMATAEILIDLLLSDDKKLQGWAIQKTQEVTKCSQQSRSVS